MVGVGGGVPDFSDFNDHVRLGDIVVGTASRQGKPVYIHCDKYESTEGRSDFTTQSWMELDHTLHAGVKKLRDLHERELHTRKPWEKYIEEGKDILHAEESSFHRPAAKNDKLFATIDGELVQVEHPRPPYGYDRYIHDNVPRVRYGPIGSNKYVARNEPLRMEFKKMFGVMAFDGAFGEVLNTLERKKKNSYLIVRGIADYEEGSKNKDWQPYAALAAASYTKALLVAIPSRRSYYNY